MGKLKDLDIQSRAVVSLVEEWRSPHKTVRAIWKVEDLIALLESATAVARQLQSSIANRNGKPLVDVDSQDDLAATAAYLLESLQRLKHAADGAVDVVEMFDSQGYSIERSAELRECASALPEIIADVEAFSEALEWQELERSAMPSDRIRAVADYLRSTGQASA